MDVFLEDDESRRHYIRRWQQNARKAFTALTNNELEALLDHVQSCDIPETVADYRRFAQAAGFTSTLSLMQGPERLNRLVVIS